MNLRLAKTLHCIEQYERPDNDKTYLQMQRMSARSKPVLHLADPYFLDYARLRPRQGSTLDV